MQTQQEFKKLALSLYRRLFRQCQLIPQINKQQHMLNDMRKEFRGIWSKESLDKEQKEFLDKMNNHLSFIEMITVRLSPLSAIKRINEERNSGFDYSKHGTRKVYLRTEEGQVIDLNEEAKNINVTKDKAAISNWRMGNIDPDYLKKHEQLMRRMRFQEGPLKDYPEKAYGIKNKW